VADEQDNPAELGGRFNEFEGGTLAFSPVTGAELCVPGVAGVELHHR